MRHFHRYLCITLVSAACGSEGPRTPPGCDAGACSSEEAGSTRAEAGGNNPSCELGPEIARRTHAQTVNCGAIGLAASLAERLSAQRCAFEAASEGRPFQLSYALQDGDSTDTEFYSSLGGPLITIMRRGDTGQVRTEISEFTGRGLSLLLNCEPSAKKLCLELREYLESGLLCTASAYTSPCRGAGNYEAGKEGSYQPCCPGLREVFQKRAAQVGESAERMCIDLPLRVYACVEGRCGDGRCEAPEAVVCGCEADCPSASPSAVAAPASAAR